LNNTANYFHYNSVGSTPVGLWAQACNKTIDPAFAYESLSTMP